MLTAKMALVPVFAGVMIVKVKNKDINNTKSGQLDSCCWDSLHSAQALLY